MHTSLECGLVMEDAERADHLCSDTEKVIAERFAPAPKPRPTGEGPMWYGKLLVGIGTLILLYVGYGLADAMTTMDSYAASDYSIMRAGQQASSMMMWGSVGGGALSLGILLWCIGYIAHAISFLPAKSD